MENHFRTIMKYFYDLMIKISTYKKECTLIIIYVLLSNKFLIDIELFKMRNHELKLDPDVIIKRFEPSEFVKKVNFLKSKEIISNTHPIEKKVTQTKNQYLADNNSPEDDGLDSSRLKLKICEIADIEYKKFRRMSSHNKANKNNILPKKRVPGF